MSLQRAQVNCDRCYTLANSILSSTEDKKQLVHFRDDQIYSARNEAMRALEEETNSLLRLRAFYPDDSQGFADNEIACVFVRECLDACVNCDYSCPKIVRLIEYKKKK